MNLTGYPAKFCKYLALFVIFGSLVLYCFNPQNSGFAVEYPATQRTTKYILFWTIIGDNRNFHFPKNGSELFENCRVSNCYATADRSLLPVEEYDAIMFYVPTSTDHEKEVLPERRSPHQRYLSYLVMETLY